MLKARKFENNFLFTMGSDVVRFGRFKMLADTDFLFSHDFDLSDNERKNHACSLRFDFAARFVTHRNNA